MWFESFSHIESRVKWFNRKHCAIFDMLTLSGFGWDNEKMMIICVKDVFYEYVKVKFLIL